MAVDSTPPSTKSNRKSTVEEKQKGQKIPSSTRETARLKCRMATTMQCQRKSEETNPLTVLGKQQDKLNED